MALVYRAIWRDAPGAALDRGHSLFAAWVGGKHGIRLPTEGSVVKPDDPGVDVRVTRAALDGVTAIRCVLHEDSPEQRWTTTLTVLESAGARAAYWVDLELVASDAFRVPQARPPRLVMDLLETGTDPRSGSILVSTAHREWRADEARELASLILEGERNLPLLLFTPDPSAGLDEAQIRARRAARNLAGVVSVGLVYPLAIRDLGDLLGPDLGVWGGAARVYLPGAGHDGTPHRHFLIPRGVLLRDPDRAWIIVADRLATAIAARRAPAEYETIRRELIPGDRAGAVLELETAYLETMVEADRLRGRADEEEQLRIDAVAELEDVNRELERQARHIAYLERVLNRAGVSEEWVDAPGATDFLPEEADSPTDAARLAREHLARVSIPDSATERTSELDAALESAVWGQTSWRGLRALHLYAEDAHRFSGFWDWCEHSGHPFAWPATAKKLAMRESSTAMGAFGGERVFDIDPRVNGEPRIVMEAHLKVSEGGGQLAPRIYFHDDTKGVTGKVHVGFFGPHRYVRNASTN